MLGVNVILGENRMLFDTISQSIATAKTVSDSKNSSGLFSSLKNAKYASNNKFRKFKHLQSISNSPNYEDYLDELILEEFNKIDSEIMKIIGQIIKSYLELDDALI